MYTISKNVSAQITVKNSRFLAEILICTSQEMARNLLKSQKAKYSDCSHVVHAFIVGNNSEICGMSDDGEPSGTAGRPILDVLRGKKCTNILLTVTRWFGGTLLGTGGLVKAYSDAAKEVLLEADIQNAFIELVEKKEVIFTIDYSMYEKVKYIMSKFNFSDITEKYEDTITISSKINKSEFADFSKIINDLTSGKININQQ